MLRVPERTVIGKSSTVAFVVTAGWKRLARRSGAQPLQVADENSGSQFARLCAPIPATRHGRMAGDVPSSENPSGSLSRAVL